MEGGQNYYGGPFEYLGDQRSLKAYINPNILSIKDSQNFLIMKNMNVSTSTEIHFNRNFKTINMISNIESGMYQQKSRVYVNPHFNHMKNNTFEAPLQIPQGLNLECLPSSLDTLVIPGGKTQSLQHLMPQSKLMQTQKNKVIENSDLGNKSKVSNVYINPNVKKYTDTLKFNLNSRYCKSVERNVSKFKVVNNRSIETKSLTKSQNERHQVDERKIQEKNMRHLQHRKLPGRNVGTVEHLLSPQKYHILTKRRLVKNSIIVKPKSHYLYYKSETKKGNKKLSVKNIDVNKKEVDQKKIIPQSVKLKLSLTSKIAKSVRTKYKYIKGLNISLAGRKGFISRYSLVRSNLKIDRRKRGTKSSTGKDNSNLILKSNTCHHPFNSQYNIQDRFSLKKLEPQVNIWKNLLFYSSKPLPLINSTICSHKSKLRNGGNLQLVNIGGILYKSTNMTLKRTSQKNTLQGNTKVYNLTLKAAPITYKNLGLSKKGNVAEFKGKNNKHAIYIHGQKYVMDSAGKTLKRVSVKSDDKEQFKLNHVKRIYLGGVTFKEKSHNVLIRTNTHTARHVLNLAKQRSIMFLRSQRKKNNLPCIIYHKFGKCSKLQNGTCPYLHKVECISICKQFLKNKCKNKNCLLSHNAVQEKVATCQFFLEGYCSREKCPYLHVKVSAKASVCKDFLNGYCKQGRKCKKRHVNICPDFDKNKKCRKGKVCPFPHMVLRKKEKKNNVLNQGSDSKQNQRYYSNTSTDVSKEIDENMGNETECREKNITTVIPKKSRKCQNELLNETEESVERKRIKLGALPSYISFNTD